MNDSDEVRILASGPEGLMLWIPDVAYFDTQAGPVEIGLDKEIAVQLRDALDQYLLRLEYPMEGCNTSRACVMRNGCRRCRPEAEGAR